MERRRVLTAAALVALVPVLAIGQTIYFTDFDGVIPEALTSTTTVVAGAGPAGVDVVLTAVAEQTNSELRVTMSQSTTFTDTSPGLDHSISMTLADTNGVQIDLNALPGGPNLVGEVYKVTLVAEFEAHPLSSDPGTGAEAVDRVYVSLDDTDPVTEEGPAEGPGNMAIGWQMANGNADPDQEGRGTELNTVSVIAPPDDSYFGEEIFSPGGNDVRTYEVILDETAGDNTANYWGLVNGEQVFKGTTSFDSAARYVFFGVFERHVQRDNDAGESGLIVHSLKVELAEAPIDGFPATIVDFDVNAADQAIITWDSMVGLAYSVLTSGDLTASNGLALLPPYTNMAGVAGTMSVTTTLAALEGYYGVESKIVPLFFDDMESGAGDWTTVTMAGATDWELGTPNYSNTRGAFTNAYSGTNARGTGLTSAYGKDVIALLRTPEIDLTGIAGAVLSFYQITDLEPLYDFGYVNILTNGVMAQTNLYAANGTSATWAQQEVDLNTFTNQKIVIEFELRSDDFDFDSDWFGWGIDDVMVRVGPPTPEPPPPFTNSVIDLVLVDSSGTNNPPPDLVSIVEGATLDLDALGVAFSNVNIRAEADGPVGSVTFALTGATVDNRTESVAPYYLFGDASGDPADGTLNSGAHTLVATPWENGGGGGQEGTNLTVNFTVTYTP